MARELVSSRRHGVMIARVVRSETAVRMFWIECTGPATDHQRSFPGIRFTSIEQAEAHADVMIATLFVAHDCAVEGCGPWVRHSEP